MHKNSVTNFNYVVLPTGNYGHMDLCFPEFSFLSPKQRFDTLFKRRGFRTLAMLGISMEYFGTYNLAYFKEKTRDFSLTETEISLRVDSIAKMAEFNRRLLFNENIEAIFHPRTKFVYQRTLGRDVLVKAFHVEPTGTSASGCVCHGSVSSSMGKR